MRKSEKERRLKLLEARRGLKKEPDRPHPLAHVHALRVDTFEEWSAQTAAASEASRAELLRAIEDEDQED